MKTIFVADSKAGQKEREQILLQTEISQDEKSARSEKRRDQPLKNGIASSHLH
jgi:hypothetical protein